MLFNSIEFLIFMPVVFILYWYVFGRMLSGKSYQLQLQNGFLLVASYVFYGMWDWRFLILIAFTSMSSYFSGIMIESVRDGKHKQAKRKAYLWLNILINIGILGIFKYYNFFVTELAELFRISSERVLLNIVLPVGISFYTFQAVSYSIDIYRGKVAATRDIVAFFAYVSYFPQLVAGPIERVEHLLPQIEKKREFDYDLSVDGMRQILWGLFKKVLIADNCAVYVDQVWADVSLHSGSTLVVAAVLFSIEIYCDFSGYSDIAIGASKLLGIRLIQNFRTPFYSRDIAEFWRRWHISLTTWFRDYVYIPLGGSRVSMAKIIRNTFIIFLLSGFWHGANWTYIAWGLYHACLFLPLIILKRNRRYCGTVAEGGNVPSFKELAQMLCTFALVVVGFIIFRAPNIRYGWYYIKQMVSHDVFSLPMDIGLMNGIVLVGGIIIMLVAEWLNRNEEHGLYLLKGKNKALQLSVYYFIIACIFFFSGSSETFIYFQF